jgi:hypothetical protein
LPEIALPHEPETVSDFFHKRIRHFEGRKVATFLALVPIDNILESLLCPAPG